MIPEDKRNYVNRLIKAIVAHDDGVIFISFYWVETDGDWHVSIPFHTSYDNIVADMYDYMYILKQFKEDYFR